MGFPHMTLEFPYKRQSPVSKQIKTFNNIQDVWEEIFLLVDSWSNSKFTLGRNLYFHLPLFMNPNWITATDFAILMKEFTWCKDFNIPIAKDLDSVDARTLEEFDVINTEILSIDNYIGEKNGR